MVFAALLLASNGLGHVLDAMDDIRQAAIRPEDRRVDGPPVTLLEAAFLPLRSAYVVFLQGHHVGNPTLQHPIQRSTHGLSARRVVVVRIVREDLEEPAAE